MFLKDTNMYITFKTKNEKFQALDRKMFRSSTINDIQLF